MEQSTNRRGGSRTAEVASTVAVDLLAIVKDVSGALDIVPVVGAIASAVGKILEIREVQHTMLLFDCDLAERSQEVSQNKELCQNLAEDVKAWSYQVFNDITRVDSSSDPGRLKALRESLEQYRRYDTPSNTL
jgi:hypothetical protein